jgi:hypothetical protein
MTAKGTAGVRVAARALGLEKRRPTEADIPPPSTFGGRPPAFIPGQLSLTETAADQRREDTNHDSA